MAVIATKMVARTKVPMKSQERMRNADLPLQMSILGMKGMALSCTALQLFLDATYMLAMNCHQAAYLDHVSQA